MRLSANQSWCLRIWLATFICLFVTPATNCQEFAEFAKAAPSVYAQCKQLIGNIPFFEGDLHCITKSNGIVHADLTAHLAVSPDAFSIEIDSADFKSQASKRPSDAKLKSLRVNKMMFLFRIKENRLYLIYPEAKLHRLEKIPSGDLDYINVLLSAGGRLEKSFEGAEIVGGYDCRKHHVILHEKAGTSEGFLWETPGLGNAPVKLELTRNQEWGSIEAKNISTNKPSPERFDVPKASVQKANDLELRKAVFQNWAQRLIDRSKDAESAKKIDGANGSPAP